MLDKVYWLRKSCTRDIVAIVSNNLLFTSLQISVEPYFLNFRMLFPKLITDYRQTNDRLVIDIVNISKSVIPLYSYTSTIYAK